MELVITNVAHVLSLTRKTVSFGLLLVALVNWPGLSAYGAVAPGPDAFGYSVAYTPDYRFTNIIDNATRVLDFDDDAAVTVPIGFSFNFYGVNYTNVSLSVNGLMSFGGQHTDYNNTNLTSRPLNPDLPAIAVMWDDYETEFGGDAIYYRTEGPPGDRQFIVQWNEVWPVESVDEEDPDTMTFEARLFETNNAILFSFPDVVLTNDLAYGRGANATVGIRDAGGHTNNYNLLWSHNQAALSNRLHILFTRPNFAPVAVNDRVVTITDRDIGIDVLANDTDIDNDPLTIAAVTQPRNGLATITSSNTIHFAVPRGFVCEEVFTYTVADIHGNQSTGEVVVVINAPNNPPVALPDSFTLQEDVTSIRFGVPGVLGNDRDPEGQPLSAVLVTPTTNGNVTLNADGSFTYSPNPNYSGLDFFIYQASDGPNLSSNALVRLTIGSVNDAPFAQSGTSTTVEDTSVEITLRGQDVDDTNLLFAILAPPVHGYLDGTPPTLTYNPSNNFHGVDVFTFRVTDPAGLSSTGAVFITVTPVNEFTPVANPDAFATFKNRTLVITNEALLANDTDADEYDILILTGVSATSSNAATVTLDRGIVTYVPPTDFTGFDFFAYTISDGQDGTAEGIVQVWVTADIIRLSTLSYNPGSNAVVNFTAPTGFVYQVQASENLVDWTNIGAAVEPFPGIFEYPDDQATNYPIRFYRITAPSP